MVRFLATLVVHNAILNMAAPGGSRSSMQNNAGMEGFPFPVTGRPPEESSSKDQTTTGDPKKKPCRACTDFKSWMKLQKPTSSASVQVNRLIWQWLPERRERDTHLRHRYESKICENKIDWMKWNTSLLGTCFEKSNSKGLDFWDFKLSNFYCLVVYCSNYGIYIFYIIYYLFIFLKYFFNSIYTK